MNLHKTDLRIIIAVLLVCLAPLVWAQNVVKKIEFKGLERIKPDELKSVIKITEGEEPSAAQIDEATKALYRSGKFSSVRVVKEPMEGGIKLVFEVQENPTIESIVIFGNKQLITADIIKAFPFKVGDFLPSDVDYLVKTKVAQLYAEKKIYKTDISVSTSPGKEKGTAVLNIYINEGKKLLIKDLLFEGNKSFSGIRLRLLVNNRGSWWFLKNYYDDETFDEDLNIIRDFYMKRGFLDVSVQRGQPIYNEAQNWVCPLIVISEGRRYKVSAIEATGYRILRKDEILSIFDPLIGHYYSGAKFAKDVKKLADLYGDEGYVQMDVKPDYVRDREKATVKIVLAIQENPLTYVGDIKIEKQQFELPTELSWLERWYQRLSPPVKEEVIRKEVLLKPGDKYRRFQEQRTEDRLRRLGIFDEVAIRREPTEKKDVMNAIVRLKEGTTAGLLFGVGYGDVTGAYVQGSFRERNLFGEAKDLELSAMIGTKTQGFHIGYLDRYFRGTRNSLRVELYRDMFRREGYDTAALGGQVELGVPSNEYLHHYFRLRAEYVSFEDVDDDIETKIDDYPVATVRYRIVHDSRDEIAWPTRGDLKSAGVELGTADGFLAKFTGSYAGYWRVYRDLIYALDSQAGFMPFDADNVGIEERFFLGGNNDMRGFKFRGAGPHDKGDDDVPIGGSVKGLVRNEMRFPIYEKLRGLVFLDAGIIDKDFPGIGDPRASAGFGFRYDIKLFYISLDFAHAFLKEHEDQTRFVHFSLGSLF